MATATAEPITNGTATPPIDDDGALGSSGTKRKRADSENIPQKDDFEQDAPVESSPQLQESLKDILKVLRK
jgi:hypothetical protein